MLLSFVGIIFIGLAPNDFPALIIRLPFPLVFPADTHTEPVSSNLGELMSLFLLLSVDRAKQVILVLLRSFVFYSGLAAFLLQFALILFKTLGIKSPTSIRSD